MNQPTPRPRFTAAIVRELVLSRLESEEPDAILAIFRAQDGKPFTKRILAKLPGGEARWHIDTIANMTHVSEREVQAREPLVEEAHRAVGRRPLERMRTRLLVAHRVSGITIDAEALFKLNASYFEGRIARNAKRRAAATDEALCGKLADALNRYVAARAECDAAERTIRSFIGYGEPFSPDDYEIERDCGMREEKK